MPREEGSGEATSVSAVVEGSSVLGGPADADVVTWLAVMGRDDSSSRRFLNGRSRYTQAGAAPRSWQREHGFSWSQACLEVLHGSQAGRLTGMVVREVLGRGVCGVGRRRRMPWGG